MLVPWRCPEKDPHGGRLVPLDSGFRGWDGVQTAARERGVRMVRVVLAGVSHHVTQRRVRSKRVFFSNADRREYLRLMTCTGAAIAEQRRADSKAGGRGSLVGKLLIQMGARIEGIFAEWHYRRMGKYKSRHRRATGDGRNQCPRCRRHSIRGA